MKPFRVVQNPGNHRNKSDGDATDCNATVFTTVVFRILHYGFTRFLRPASSALDLVSDRLQFRSHAINVTSLKFQFAVRDSSAGPTAVLQAF